MKKVTEQIASLITCFFIAKLEKRNADEQSVISENKSALDAFRKEVKELLNKKTM